MNDFALGGLKITFIALVAQSSVTTLPQQPSRLPDVPAASVAKLHSAWMLEVLDLDSALAARVYEQVAADRRPQNLARWVAAARLRELQRLGVSEGPPIDLAEAPQMLRPAFDGAAQGLDIPAILKRISGEPEAVLLDIAAEPESLPPLRPVVATAESWFVDQVGPSRLDRLRQRRAELADRPPFTDRVFAAWILRDEVEGRRTQADEKRSIYFMLWQPPKPAGDPKVELERFRRNIETLLAEREWTYPFRQLHGQLQTTIEQMAADDPAAAMALVRRVPQYAERLLAPVPQEPR